jgi:predicted RNA-binding Zn-ribbon protein involved in translation (DUF1610 family)
MTATQPEGLDMTKLTDEQIMNIADSYSFTWDEGIVAFARALLSASKPAAPIDMLLFCPNCGTQHIDAPEEHERDEGLSVRMDVSWTNPPHRSHLCHACECIWRPADVPTNGVAAITTKGKADTWLAASPAAPAQSGEPVAKFELTDSEIQACSMEPAILRLLANTHEDIASDAETLDNEVRTSYHVTRASELNAKADAEEREMKDRGDYAAPQSSQPVEAGELTHCPQCRAGLQYAECSNCGFDTTRIEPAAVVLDVSVLARLSAQIFDCPLNPTISKFARAVEANVRSVQPVEQTRALTDERGKIDAAYAKGYSAGWSNGPYGCAAPLKTTSQKDQAMTREQRNVIAEVATALEMQAEHERNLGIYEGEAMFDDLAKRLNGILTAAQPASGANHD